MMTALPAALTILSAVCAGAILGYVFGFSRSADAAVTNGVRPKTRNRFLVFIFRPVAGYHLGEAFLFLLLMAAWMVIFFVLVATPILVGAKLFGLQLAFVKMTYVLFFGFMFIAWRFGAKAWRRLA